MLYDTARQSLALDSIKVTTTKEFCEFSWNPAVANKRLSDDNNLHLTVSY